MTYYDRLPVITLPDGRLFLVDSGMVGHAVLGVTQAPVTLPSGRTFTPTANGFPIREIGEKLEAPRLDGIVGWMALHSGLTLTFNPDRTHGTFTDGIVRNGREQVLVEIPSSGFGWGGVIPGLQAFMPHGGWVEMDLNGERASGPFDTGNPHTVLHGYRAEDTLGAEVTNQGQDFHVDHGNPFGGGLVEFQVEIREMLLTAGDHNLTADVAYLPETWPRWLPSTVYGMGLPEIIGASRLTLSDDGLAMFTNRRSTVGWGAPAEGILLQAMNR